MPGVDLDTGLPVGQRARRDRAPHPARPLLLALAALALAAALLRQSAGDASRPPPRRDDQPPTVEPEARPSTR
ncbi:MAG: hypothetical protein R3A48_00065 [Polyangiales bacterium]